MCICTHLKWVRWQRLKDIVVLCHHDLLEPFMYFLVNSHTSSLRYLLNLCLQPLVTLGDELALMVLLFQSKNELRPTEITIVGVDWWCSSADVRFYCPFCLNLKGRSVTYIFCSNFFSLFPMHNRHESSRARICDIQEMLLRTDGR